MLRRILASFLVFTQLLSASDCDAFSQPPSPVTQPTISNQAFVGTAIFVVSPIAAQAAVVGRQIVRVAPHGSPISLKETVGLLFVAGLAWSFAGPLQSKIKEVIEFQWIEKKMAQMGLDLRFIKKFGESSFSTNIQVYSPEHGDAVLKIAGGQYKDLITIANGNLLDEKVRLEKLADTGTAPKFYAIHEAQSPTDEVVLLKEFIDGPTLAEALTSNQITYDEAIEKVRDLFFDMYMAGVELKDTMPHDLFLQPDGRLRICDVNLSLLIENPQTQNAVAAWDDIKREWEEKLEKAGIAKAEERVAARKELERVKWYQHPFITLRYFLFRSLLKQVRKIQESMPGYAQQQSEFIKRVNMAFGGWILKRRFRFETVLTWILSKPLRGYSYWPNAIAAWTQRGLGFFGHVWAPDGKTWDHNHAGSIGFFMVTQPGMYQQTIEVVNDSAAPFFQGTLSGQTVRIRRSDWQPLSMDHVYSFSGDLRYFHALHNQSDRPIAVGELCANVIKDLPQTIDVMIPIHQDPTRGYIFSRKTDDMTRPLVEVFREQSYPVSAQGLVAELQGRSEGELQVPIFTTQGTALIDRRDAIAFLRKEGAQVWKTLDGLYLLGLPELNPHVILDAKSRFTGRAA